MYRKGDHDKVIQNSILRLMVGFSKYEFYNKLLGGVTLFRITLGITWTQPYIKVHSFQRKLEYSQVSYQR